MSELELGQRLGKHQIQRLLGRGGMGEVYLATHVVSGGEVAIKVLSAKSARDPVLVERFSNEARAVNRIQHESIVSVLDLDWLPDGRPFIVMEHLDGSSLTKALRGGPLPPPVMARLAGEVLAALDAAHRAGIVHRDLKPDNVHVTSAGRVKILDFGIAKLMGDSTVPALTRSREVLGTPHYMAPEQITGARHVDARTDLYALGVILFEGVTGRPPFHATSIFELFKLHLDAAPPWPRQLQPALSPAYEAVILRALEKDPARRFASAAEMAAALRAASESPAPQPPAPLGVSAQVDPLATTSPDDGQEVTVRDPAPGQATVRRPAGAPPADPSTTPTLARPRRDTIKGH